MATAGSQNDAVHVAYRHWAGEYDDSPNPITALEGRVLTALLHTLETSDVLDLGCGTGRNFKLFRDRNARTVTGVDLSPEMLHVAARKAGKNTRLLRADVCDLPLPDRSVDFVVASLMASYVSELCALANEIRRLCRSDATVIVTDVHPDSIRKFGWKRLSQGGSESVPLPARQHSVRDVIDAFEFACFTTEIAVDVPFGEPEKAIFSATGKLADFDRFARDPAIYFLQFTPKRRSATVASVGFRNCEFVLGSDLLARGSLQSSDGKISSFGASEVDQVDLTEMTVFPGLINAHDHLEFGLFPRLGDRMYRAAGEWARSIHSTYSSTISRHRRLERDSRCKWGALRNTLAGVTTVSHHNALYPSLETPEFPVRVTKNYSWAHSLDFGDNIEDSHRDCEDDTPFIIHAGEGTDGSTSRREFHQLLKRGVLDKRTVIVHGIAFGVSELKAIEELGCSLVWCPSSNYFLFGETHAPQTIEDFPRVALGSDSPLTAVGDLLDEIRFAHEVVGVSARSLFHQVTTTAANILRLREGEGTLRVHAHADFFAVSSDHTASPADRLASLSYRDIELVAVGGEVKIASARLYDRLPSSMQFGMAPIEIDGTLRWVRYPLARLFSKTETALGSDIRMMGRKVQHVASAWL